MDMRSLMAAVALAMCLAGCAPKTPQGGAADDQRATLVQRAEAFKRDAVARPVLVPERKSELQQLAADVRAWQARTKRDDLRVTQDSVKARRNDNPGGGGDCEDCPGYRVDGDRICFLETEGECPVDDGSDLQLGRVCVYTCIWIGADPEPARKGA